jgi:hypothetical protein
MKTFLRVVYRLSLSSGINAALAAPFEHRETRLVRRPVGQNDVLGLA